MDQSHKIINWVKGLHFLPQITEVLDTTIQF